VDEATGDKLHVSEAHRVSGHAYGDFFLLSDGTYQYSLDNDDPLVQALAVGETATEVWSYTVTNLEGQTSQTTLTFTIEGTNDRPVITSGTQSGAVTEVVDLAAGENSTTHHQSGTVTFGDVDLSDVETSSIANTIVAPTLAHGYVLTAAQQAALVNAF